MLINRTMDVDINTGLQLEVAHYILHMKTDKK